VKLLSLATWDGWFTKKEKSKKGWGKRILEQAPLFVGGGKGEFVTRMTCLQRRNEGE